MNLKEIRTVYYSALLFIVLMGMVSGMTACGKERPQGAVEINQYMPPYNPSGNNPPSQDTFPGMHGLSLADPFNSKLELDKDTAQQIAAMNGIKSVQVIRMNGDAFVALALANRNTTAEAKVPPQFEAKVAAIVRAARPDVKRIYVSANPIFIDRTKAIVEDLQNGIHTAGAINEFQSIVERLFPAM
jgi:YhcN/YlaJ family sporulation lipoprotein